MRCHIFSERYGQQQLYFSKVYLFKEHFSKVYLFKVYFFVQLFLRSVPDLRIHKLCELILKASCVRSHGTTCVALHVTQHVQLYSLSWSFCAKCFLHLFHIVAPPFFVYSATNSTFMWWCFPAYFKLNSTQSLELMLWVPLISYLCVFPPLSVYFDPWSNSLSFHRLPVEMNLY